MTGSSISSTLTISVTLGSGGYDSPLTITTTGKVAPTTSASNAVYAASGTIINYGSILAGFGDTSFQSGSSAIGVVLDNATFENSGFVRGGFGKYSLSTGGDGVSLHGGLLVNSGSIRGGLGVNPSISPNGASNYKGIGAFGVNLDGGTVENSGMIAGGDGGNGQYGYAGATGLYEASGLLTNTGTIVGGDDSGSTLDDQNFPGAGADLAGGSLLNQGLIVGGTALNYSVGGIGVTMSGGILTNTGIIAGGAGPGVSLSPGGEGVVLTNGTLFNDGTIIGGQRDPSATAGQGGSGGLVTGGTLLNTGTILGADAQSVSSSESFVFNSAGSGITLDGGLVINLGDISGGNGGNQTVGGGNYGVVLDAGTLVTDGTIIGGIDQFDVRHDAVSFGGSGLLVIEPDALFIGNVTGSGKGTLQLGTNSSGSEGELNLGSSFSGFTTITFDDSAAWLLNGDSAALAGGEVITGFDKQDTLELQGFSVSSDTFVPGTGLILTDGTATETLDIVGSFSTSSFVINNLSVVTFIELCYLAGTRIATPAGEVPVEALAIGDAVITRFGGYRRIKWIGRQSYGRRFIQNNRAQIPVRIHAGALGPNLPKRDLFVSPGHSMLLGGVLVLARDLVNGITITQAACPDEVHYYQLEFETHDCVLAEGAWSESFCDYADLRNQFHNVADFWRLYPDYVTPETHKMCAPRPDAGPDFAAAITPVVARATALTCFGKLQGQVDEVAADGTIRGWAQDGANPELPVQLEIRLHGQLLGTVLACDHRADLEAAGIGRGRCAFAANVGPIPRAVLPAITIQRGGLALSIAPRSIQRRTLSRRRA